MEDRGTQAHTHTGRVSGSQRDTGTYTGLENAGRQRDTGTQRRRAIGRQTQAHSQEVRVEDGDRHKDRTSWWERDRHRHTHRTQKWQTEIHRYTADRTQGSGRQIQAHRQDTRLSGRQRGTSTQTGRASGPTTSRCFVSIPCFQINRLDESFRAFPECGDNYFAVVLL